MVFIIGPKGSGKPMTPNHKQNSSKYNDWNETAVRSLEDPDIFRPL